ncbi:MAG: flagellin, partial [Thermoguttaceae bacterium]
MSRINTNVSSLLAQQNLSRTNDQLQQSLERLSTGLRINSGKDDPAGLIASEALQSDIVSTQQAVSNSQTADQMINTADSALGQIGTLLNNIRGLITASANQGAMSSDQLAANQLQVDSSLDAINRIAETTNFQNQRLLDGSLGFQTTGTTNFSSANNIDIQQAQLVGNAGQAVNVNVTSAASQASLALNVPDAAGPISQASGSLTLNNGAAAQATGTDTLSAGSATQATGTVTLNSVAATLTAVPGGALDGAAGNQTFTVDLAFGQASAGATLSGTTLTVNVTAASGTATLKDVESAIHTSAATTGLDATVVNADSATTV